jgi:hypothetical protein
MVMLYVLMERRHGVAIACSAFAAETQTRWLVMH